MGELYKFILSACLGQNLSMEMIIQNSNSGSVGHLCWKPVIWLHYGTFWSNVSNLSAERKEAQRGGTRERAQSHIFWIVVENPARVTWQSAHMWPVTKWLIDASYSTKFDFVCIRVLIIRLFSVWWSDAHLLVIVPRLTFFFFFFFYDYSVKYTKAKKSSVHSNGVKLHIVSWKEKKTKQNNIKFAWIYK